MITHEQIPRIVGQPVYDPQGRKIGPAKHMYLDDATGEPVWVTVRTGLFGGREAFVPTGGARVVEGRLEVPFGKSQVKDAPDVPLDSRGHLSAEQERRLYGYYGLPVPGEPPTAGTGPTTMSGSEAGVGTGPSPEGDRPGPRGPSGRSRSARTWSEEEMGPGTGRRPQDPEER
jgi:PRC-barrel domain protein